jgi:hypothetical protein
VNADDVEPTTWALASMGRGLSSFEYIAALHWLHAYTRRTADWWTSGFDVLVNTNAGGTAAAVGRALGDTG